LFSVPQGSVLGPLLFLLYVAEVAEVLAAHGFKGHSYADDTQMHINVPAADAVDAALCLSDCIVSIESWMSSHCLKMNPRQDSATVDRNIVTVNEVALSTGPLGFSTVVSNLGVHFDEQLSMADHITVVCKSCFFQLRQLHLIRSYLTMDSAKTLVHAFISVRLDYCNSLLVGAADCIIQKLQAVQNAAAQLINGTRKFDHITPILWDLHWLPVHQQIKYKIAMLLN